MSYLRLLSDDVSQAVGRRSTTPQLGYQHLDKPAHLRYLTMQLYQSLLRLHRHHVGCVTAVDTTMLVVVVVWGAARGCTGVPVQRRPALCVGNRGQGQAVFQALQPHDGVFFLRIAEGGTSLEHGLA